MNNFFKIYVKIQAGSKTNAIVKIDSNKTLKILIKSQPINGKANTELISYLSSVLKTYKKNVVIAKGLTSKLKTLHIYSYNEEDFSHAIMQTIKSYKR